MKKYGNKEIVLDIEYVAKMLNTTKHSIETNNK